MQKKLIVYAIILVALEFYSFNGLSESVFVGIQYFTLMLIAFRLFRENKKQTGLVQPNYPKNFGLWLILMVTSVLISFLPALIYHDQPIIYSFAGMRAFGFILLYFYLHKVKFSVVSLEDIIIFVALAFQVLYVFEIRFMPNNPLFGKSWTEIVTDLTRILILGRHVVMLAFCILLTRFMQGPKYIFLFAFCLLSIIMFQTRQLLLPAGLVTLFHFRKIVFKSIVPALALVAIIAIGAYFGNTFISKLIQKSSNKSVVQMGGDRDKSYAYYLNFPSTNEITTVLGEGYPVSGTIYFKSYQTWHDTSGLSPNDIGPVGYVAYFGYLWLISVIVLLFKAFTLKVPEKYVYVKYFFICVICTMPVGENQFFSSSSIIALCMAFYIVDRGNFEVKNPIAGIWK